MGGFFGKNEPEENKSMAFKQENRKRNIISFFGKEKRQDSNKITLAYLK
jgi:hypothetical protein